jgi:hypothetical protein
MEEFNHISLGDVGTQIIAGTFAHHGGGRKSKAIERTT